MTKGILRNPKPKHEFMPRSAEPINLIAMIGHGDADILPFFLDHYRKLGIAGFVLAFHGDWSAAELERLDAEPDLHIWDVLSGEYSDRLRRSVLNAMARSFRDRWIVHADADEFLELPLASLERTVRTLDVLGLDGLPALMVQRQTADGSLPALDPKRDIDAQHPCCNVTLCEDMGLEWPAWKAKYPLMRVTPDFEMRRGNHLPPNGRPLDHAPIRAVVHHYKWRKALIAALDRPRGEGSNLGEMAVYRAWLEENDGRLPTDGARRFARADLFRRGFLVAPDRVELRAGALRRKAKDAAFGERSKREALARALRGLRSEREAVPDPDRAAALMDPANLLLRPGRICLLTFEIAPPFSGGTGSAMTVLAEHLSAAGHDVHVVLCPFAGPKDIWPGWYDYWSARGVTLDYVPRRVARHAAYEEQFAFCRKLGKRVLDLEPDLIHCADAGGYGALLAALIRAGLAGDPARLMVTAHGSTSWSARANRVRWSNDEAAQAYCHEIALALADVVCFPSRYMMELEAGTGARCGIVVPNGLLGETRSFMREREDGLRTVNELVFFGRIEPRKGYDRFEAAILDLLERGHRDFSVTLLGKIGERTPPDVIEALVGEKRIRTRHIANLNHVDAVNYLRSRDCLAIVPSRTDNLPYTVYECLENGIPLLASPTGGIPEMVRFEDRSRILLADREDALADALADALDNGFRPAALAFDPALVDLDLLAIHAGLVDEARRTRMRTAFEERAPRDVTAIVYGDRVRSTTSLLLARLETAVDADELSAVHVRIPEMDARSGRAGSAMADPAADADLLLGCHAAVLPDPEALRAMRRLLQAAACDAVVCDCRVGLSGQGALADEVLTAPGGPALEAPCRNLFGAGFFLITRDAFLSTGGFDMETGDHELAHWVLLDRLTAKGGRVVGLPAVLATLRIDAPTALLDLVTDELAEALIRPWIDAAPVAEDLIRKGAADFGRWPEMRRIADDLAAKAEDHEVEGLGLSRR